MIVLPLDLKIPTDNMRKINLRYSYLFVDPLQYFHVFDDLHDLEVAEEGPAVIEPNKGFLHNGMIIFDSF